MSPDPGQTRPVAGTGGAIGATGVVRAARGRINADPAAPRANTAATASAGRYPATNSVAEPYPPVAANTAPPIATPNAPPIWRRVLKTPDAFARSAGATRLTADRVIAGIAMPRPAPLSMIGRTSRRYDAGGPAASASQPMPAPNTSAPAAISARAPTRSASAPVYGASAIGRMPHGSSRRPAASGLRA